MSFLKQAASTPSFITVSLPTDRLSIIRPERPMKGARAYFLFLYIAIYIRLCYNHFGKIYKATGRTKTGAATEKYYERGLIWITKSKAP